MEECERFINMKRKSRHLKTFEHQRLKFEKLCHKYKKTKDGHSDIHHGNHGQTSIVTATDSNFNSNPNSTNNTWVRNISSTPLTEAQEKLLAHGPNYAVVSRFLPIREYIAVVEQACQQLKQGEAEELQGKVKVILKKKQPPGQTSPTKSKKH